jgi:hypothetical protein
LPKRTGLGRVATWEIEKATRGKRIGECPPQILRRCATPTDAQFGGCRYELLRVGVTPVEIDEAVGNTRVVDETCHVSAMDVASSKRKTSRGVWSAT